MSKSEKTDKGPETQAPAPAAAAPAAKTVKIKLLRECVIKNAKGEDQLEIAGSIHHVDEERAKELCDRQFKGYEPYYGMKPAIIGVEDVLARQHITRAVRIA